MNNSFLPAKLLSLDKRIKAFSLGYRQNIALLGDDSQEISYLIEKYLIHDRLDDIVYLRLCTNYMCQREFFKATAFSLLSNYLKKADSLDNLINYSALNLTTDFIKNCLKKDKITFLDILEVINQFINETKRQCLLIIEEFLGLNKLFDDFYQDFSKFIILQRKCMIVLTTSCFKDAQKIFAGELNLLFGNFEKISLNDNQYSDNYSYLQQILLPTSPSAFFLSFFINIMGSNIIYYDFIAQAIKTSYRFEDENCSIISIMEDILYPRQTYLFQQFIKRIDLLKLDFRDTIGVIRLLFALSEGYLRKKELVSLGIYDSGELSLRLQKMVDLNYIVNLGNIYKIKDPLFSFWLSYIFKFYFSQPVLDPSWQKLLYRNKLREGILIFGEQFFEDKIKKIMQLFSSFKNDTLAIGRDRYRLSSVVNLKMFSYPENDLHLLIGEGKEIVFVGIKEKNIEDNDIFDFIERGTNIRGKRVKKIFICLGSLSSAARLIAKNNKLVIWDINEVNRLLMIYNKSTVFCEPKT